MTTVAYKSGTIAADTGLCGGSTLDCHIDKIAKRKDGSVAGAAGEAWWIVAFLKWFVDGGEQPHAASDGGTAIMINKRRVVTLYESANGVTRSFEATAPYHAIGSGRAIALGALFAKAHPVDAVKAAIMHNDGTHGRVKSLKVGW